MNLTELSRLPTTIIEQRIIGLKHNIRGLVREMNSADGSRERRMVLVQCIQKNNELLRGYEMEIQRRRQHRPIIRIPEMKPLRGPFIAL